ncbi:MAG: C40 family peptidase [Lachnospiraceae bacterium]|nr:C40 family peptidase [Lachnospiraceae bacterium]
MRKAFFKISALLLAASVSVTSLAAGLLPNSAVSADDSSVTVSSFSAAELGAALAQESYYASFGSVAVEEKASRSGITGTLSRFFRAYTSGAVEEEVTRALDTLTSDEARQELEAKTAVVDSYENLGIARPTGYLNVRQKADSSAKIIGKMLRNAACEIVGESGNWYQIESGSVKGYVSKDFIVTGEEAREIALEHVEHRVIVTSNGNLNVRQEPSTDAKIVDKVAENERYDVEESLEGWIKIHVGVNEDGKDVYGYISSEFADVRYCLAEAVEFTPVSAKTKLRTDLVNFAMRYLGNRYVFGGTSLTGGIDCSGFVMRIYEHFGYSLPRTSAEQAKIGRRISSSQMQPGDLIFYTYGRGRICHVAMYIGGGKIIHAANSKKGIIISRWNASTPARIISVIRD